MCAECRNNCDRVSTEKRQTDLKQIIIRPRNCLLLLLFFVFFFIVVDFVGDLDKCFFFHCWLRCVLCLFLGDYIFHCKTTKRNGKPKWHEWHRSHLFNIAKKKKRNEISSADTLQQTIRSPHFFCANCVCTLFHIVFFFCFVLRFTCRKSHKIH